MPKKEGRAAKREMEWTQRDPPTISDMGFKKSGGRGGEFEKRQGGTKT